MQVHIDASAIRDNIRVLGERLDSPVMAVVKANAYGHGALTAARAALEGGATWLACADTGEALALRAAGITAPILAWLQSDDPRFAEAAAASIDLGISTHAQLERAAEVGARVHLKVDTGLGRNGFPLGTWPVVAGRAADLQREDRLRVVGIFSHVSGTSPESDLAQLAAFDDALSVASGLEPDEVHIAASSFAIGTPAARGTLVRLGIASYGLHPDGSPNHDGAAGRALGIRPAMRVTARVADGLLDAGVRHGLLTPLGGAALPVRVADRMVMLSELGEWQSTIDGPDGEAVLFGDPARDEPSAEAWASAAGTISYEVVTRMRPTRPAKVAA